MKFRFTYFVIFCIISSFTLSEIGAKLVYDYESQVQSKVGSIGGKSKDPRSQHLSFKVSAELSLTPIWQDKQNQSLVQLQVSNPQILTWYATQHGSEQTLDQLKNSFLLHFGSSKIQVFSTETKIEVLNFQRGLASLFLFRQENIEIDETDVLGKCRTIYGQDRHGLHKSKENCQVSQPQQNGLFDTWQYSNIKSTYKLNQEGIIDSLEVREWVEFYPQLTPELAQDLQQRQKLTLKEQKDDKEWENFQASDLEGAISKISTSLGLDFKPHGIQAESETSKKKPKSFKSILTSSKKHLKEKNLATKESAQAYLKIHQSLNVATKEDVLAVFKDKNLQELMPQIMDIVGGSGNTLAHMTAYELYTNPSNLKTLEVSERYFLALAQNKMLPESILEFYLDLLKGKNPIKITNPKMQETFLLSLAACTKRSGNPKLHLNLVGFLVQNLLKCKEDVQCYQMYLRALKNSQSATVIPILLKLVESNLDQKSAVIALETLKVFQPKILRDKVKHLDQHLLTIAQDPTKSLSLKSTSLELLLSTYQNEVIVEEICKILRQENDKELTSITLQKWLTLSGEYPDVNVLLRKSLQNGWLNWNLLSHGGLSTNFNRKLSQSLAGNSSFTFTVEISGLLMKRSNVELGFVQESGEKTNFLELGIFAGGLSSFMSNDEKATKEDDPEANAGMVLNVLGNQLRPFVFFNNMGELMSLYWSGATEKRTSALQGNLLLQNGDLEHFLSNGIKMKLANQGAISYDLSGQASISMWSKESDSTVNNKLAYFMTQSASLQLLDLPAFVQDTQVDTKIGLDLLNNVDFSGDKVKTCVRVTQPQVSINQETISKWLNNEKSTSKAKSVIQARTLFLNDKNNELCNKLFPK